ncbi:hypothetical protein ACLQ24_27385, partial [Micromonospora sp. DT4]|uniref:hypothetical protein n=1 Tax=Micromonospora sp. DT4 TaxID=3393438 RepID=UPI003CEBCD9E
FHNCPTRRLRPCRANQPLCVAEITSPQPEINFEGEESYRETRHPRDEERGTAASGSRPEISGDEAAAIAAVIGRSSTVPAGAAGPPTWSLRLTDGITADSENSHVYVIAGSRAEELQTLVVQLREVANAEHPVVVLGTPRRGKEAVAAGDVRSLNYLLEQFAQRGQLPVVVRRGDADVDLLRVAERYGAAVLHQSYERRPGGAASLDPQWRVSVVLPGGETVTSADLWPVPEITFAVLEARRWARPTAAVAPVNDDLGALVWADDFKDCRAVFAGLRERWSSQRMKAGLAQVEQMIQRVPDEPALRVVASVLHFGEAGEADIVFDYVTATEADRPVELVRAVGQVEAIYRAVAHHDGLSTLALSSLVDAVDGRLDGSVTLSGSLLEAINYIKVGQFKGAEDFIRKNKGRVPHERREELIDAVAALQSVVPDPKNELPLLMAAVADC